MMSNFRSVFFGLPSLPCSRCLRSRRRRSWRLFSSSGSKDLLLIDDSEFRRTRCFWGDGSAKISSSPDGRGLWFDPVAARRARNASSCERVGRWPRRGPRGGTFSPLDDPVGPLLVFDLDGGGRTPLLGRDFGLSSNVRLSWNPLISSISAVRDFGLWFPLSNCVCICTFGGGGLEIRKGLIQSKIRYDVRINLLHCLSRLVLAPLHPMQKTSYLEIAGLYLRCWRMYRERDFVRPAVEVRVGMVGLRGSLERLRDFGMDCLRTNWGTVLGMYPNLYNTQWMLVMGRSLHWYDAGRPNLSCLKQIAPGMTRQPKKKWVMHWALGALGISKSRLRCPWGGEHWPVLPGWARDIVAIPRMIFQD